MARTRTTKGLASRIELDYYRRRHPLRAWRARLAAIAFALPLLLLAGSIVGGDQRILSPGPLSTAHAAFAARCEACHVPWVGVEDAGCSTCHAAERHAAAQSFDPSCASCHLEHRGRATLARNDDAHCTQCHADLTVRGDRQSIDFVRHVESFALHPEFAFKREQIADPTTLKLDHQKHLTTVMPSLGRKLVCGDCHVPEDDGRRMRPTAWARDCAGCHALELQGRLAPAAVTHGRTIPAMRDELRSLATARVLDLLAARDVEAPPPLLPGGRSRKEALADPSVRQWIDGAVDEAIDFLVTTRCQECHELERNAVGGPTRVEPSALPARWLPYSDFDHHRHQASACTDCHATAPISTRSADVNLPAVALCKSCHADGGSARDDCVLCHDYHPHREDLGRAQSKEVIERLRRARAPR